jgi:hypothetical protein
MTLITVSDVPMAWARLVFIEQIDPPVGGHQLNFWQFTC